MFYLFVIICGLVGGLMLAIRVSKHLHAVRIYTTRAAEPE